MDLQEFVEQALTQIVAGVAAAQKSTALYRAKVAPELSTTGKDAAAQGFLHCADYGLAQIVQFDVALTVVETAAKKGGIGIYAGPISIGGSGQSDSEKSSVSRVRFSVPLALPTDTKPD